MRDEIVEEYLARSLIKDDAKGGDGWRNIREIANACDFKKPKMIMASKAVIELEQAGVAHVSMGKDGVIVAKYALGLQKAQEINPTYIP